MISAGRNQPDELNYIPQRQLLNGIETVKRISHEPAACAAGRKGTTMADYSKNLKEE